MNCLSHPVDRELPWRNRLLLLMMEWRCRGTNKHIQIQISHFLLACFCLPIVISTSLFLILNLMFYQNKFFLNIFAIRNKMFCAFCQNFCASVPDALKLVMDFVVVQHAKSRLLFGFFTSFFQKKVRKQIVVEGIENHIGQNAYVIMTRILYSFFDISL